MSVLQFQLDPTRERRLAERAARSGKDIPTFLREMVQRELDRPTFAEIFKPIQDACAGHGMSEDEVLEFLEAERDAMWAERRALELRPDAESAGDHGKSK